jgi:hypothetical protein
MSAIGPLTRSTCRQCSRVNRQSLSLLRTISTVPVFQVTTARSNIPPSREASRKLAQRSFFSLTDVAKLLPGENNAGDADEIQRFHARKILP